eukprot:scaffold31941_cov69-Attheya_sp.AAC.6
MELMERNISKTQMMRDLILIPNPIRKRNRIASIQPLLVRRGGICSAVQTSRRQRRAQRRELYAFKENGDDQGGRTETDSHANTSVVGKECLVFHDFERPVNVSGFDSSFGTVNDRSVISAALAYDDPTTGEVIIVIIHQAITSPTMDHNLLCPMQLRMNEEVMIDDCPKFFI